MLPCPAQSGYYLTINQAYQDRHSIQNVTFYIDNEALGSQERKEEKLKSFLEHNTRLKIRNDLLLPKPIMDGRASCNQHTFYGQNENLTQCLCYGDFRIAEVGVKMR